jgi:serine/threonine-protein kinase
LQIETVEIEGKKRLNLNQEQKVSILHGICSALVYMHSRNKNNQYAHRDLKPDNIMLLNGRAKLIDFGTAKLNPVTTQSLGAQGTYNWMSPEQVRQESIFVKKHV